MARAKHPEIQIYEAQAAEDAQADREGREPRLIATMGDVLARRAFPVGAHVLVDGRYRATVAAAFPEGSTSAAFPHYKVNFRRGDMNVAVACPALGGSQAERDRADLLEALQGLAGWAADRLNAAEEDADGELRETVAELRAELGVLKAQLRTVQTCAERAKPRRRKAVP